MARPVPSENTDEGPKLDWNRDPLFPCALLCSALPHTATSLSGSSRCRDAVSLISQMATSSAVVERVRCLWLQHPPGWLERRTERVATVATHKAVVRIDRLDRASRSLAGFRAASVIAMATPFPPHPTPALSTSRDGCNCSAILASMRPEIPSRSRMHLDHMRTLASALRVHTANGTWRRSFGGARELHLPACSQASRLET